MTSPVHASIACSKFAVTPSGTGFSMTTIAMRGARARISSRATFTVSSRDASSEITISFGGTVCSRIEATCSSMKRAPLWVHSATEIFTSERAGSCP
jgi:hypothetical protein